MKHIIVGTAGHIDHGKSALVRALTGIEPDRWEEERRRGISIDLGFAHLDLGELRVGFVDVPGHERFVKNMLAGAGGIDFVVLVVAADESVMPQTREHFDICRLLGVRAGLVAVTKCDLVDAEMLELVKLEVEEFVRGSFLEGAPVVAVSARTGAGLEELKAALSRAGMAVSGKDAGGHLRLPVDRSFTLRGFGTVVTGTLAGGTLAAEGEVEVHPLGRRLRVRGVQVHGQAVGQARAGQRTAVNLAGVEAEELHRGMTLAEPGVLRAADRIDCEIELLPGAKPLKHGAPVHFHAWASEIEAKVRLFEAAALRPGERGVGRIVLREPALLLPGDRFILRSFSPVTTIGGGVVVDIGGPERMRRAALGARTRQLMDAPAEERVAILVRESKHGMSRGELIARTGLRKSEIRDEEWLVDAGWLAGRRAALVRLVTEFHRRNPLAAGMAKEEARAKVLGGAPAAVASRLFEGFGGVVVEGDLVRSAAHRLSLKEDERAAMQAIELAFAEGGLAAPPAEEVLAKCGVEGMRARALMQILFRQKRLVRVSDELVFHSTALDRLRGAVWARRGQRFTVGDFKEWTGVSRKYAIPLLEFLDRERVTRREGDRRVAL
jgi:selenocysteine-specific elongation factor